MLNETETLATNHKHESRFPESVSVRYHEHCPNTYVYVRVLDRENALLILLPVQLNTRREEDLDTGEVNKITATCSTGLEHVKIKFERH